MRIKYKSDEKITLAVRTTNRLGINVKTDTMQIDAMSVTKNFSVHTSVKTDDTGFSVTHKHTGYTLSSIVGGDSLVNAISMAKAFEDLKIDWSISDINLLAASIDPEFNAVIKNISLGRS